jgi:hypothetical protein
MNAMLEPRIVAASTHEPETMCDSLEAADRIAVSSHGALAIFAMAYCELKSPEVASAEILSG